MTGLGIYSDMTFADIETALNTLGEIVNLGGLDNVDEMSERQLEVAWQVYALWQKEQER